LYIQKEEGLNTCYPLILNMKMRSKLFGFLIGIILVSLLSVNFASAELTWWNRTDGFSVPNIAGSEVSMTQGIASNSSDIWILDINRTFINHFDRNLNNLSDGFDVDISGCTAPRGLFFNGTQLIATEDSSDALCVMNLDGSLAGGMGADLQSIFINMGSDLIGVSGNQSDLWISENSQIALFHLLPDYTSGGVINFTGLTGELSIRGSIFNGSDLYVIGGDTEKIYHLDLNGNLYENFSVAGFGITEPTDFAFYQKEDYMNEPITDLWVIGQDTNFVYHISTTEFSSYPEINSIAIAPSPVYDTDILNCSAIYNDADANVGNVSIYWYNGTNLYSEITKLDINNGQMISDLLTAGIQEGGEIWNCTMNATDSEGASGIPNSSVTTIATYKITDCRNITTSGSYVLTTNLTDKTNATCLEISANDVHIDCQNHNIDGVASTSGNNAIKDNEYKNITIENCDISEWEAGIRLSYADNSEIKNNLVREMYFGGGIVILHSNYVNLINNTVRNDAVQFIGAGVVLLNTSSSKVENTVIKGYNYGDSSGYYGLRLTTGSQDNYIKDMQIRTLEYGMRLDGSAKDTLFENIQIQDIKGIYSKPSIGIFLSTVSNFTFKNTTITTVIKSSAPASTVQGAVAVSNGADKIFFIDSNISTTDTYDISIRDNGNLVNITFLNVNETSENFLNDYSSNTYFYRKWYLTANATYSNGLAVSSAEILFYDKDSTLKGNQTTNALGLTVSNQTQYLYQDTGAGAKTYFSNYSINAKKGNYLGDARDINLTSNYQADIVMTSIQIVQPSLVITPYNDFAYPTSVINCSTIARGNETIYINFSWIRNGAVEESTWVETNAGNTTMNTYGGSKSVGDNIICEVYANYSSEMSDTKQTSAVTIIEQNTLPVCQNITVSGAYKLANSITDSNSPICFEFSADDISIDCQNYIVDGNSTTGSSAFRGIYKSNLTAKNCIITNWFYPFYLGNNDYIAIDNNYINDNTAGELFFYGSKYINYTNNLLNNTHSGFQGGGVTNSFFINNTFDRGSLGGSLSAGIYFDSGSGNNYVKDIWIRGFARGLILENASNNYFENIIIKDIQFGSSHGTYPSLAIEFTCWGDCGRYNTFRNITIKNVISNPSASFPNCAVSFQGYSRGNIFIDSNISSEDSNTYDVCGLNNFFPTFQNNTFLNTNFSTQFIQDGNINIYKMWYLTATILDYGSNPLENSFVSVYDKDSNLIENKSSDAQGKTKFNLTEYMANATATVYYSPYNISATKTNYSDNSTLANLSYNLEFDLFMRVSNTAPYITNIQILPNPIYKSDTLNCSAIYNDDESNSGAVSITWYNGSIEYSTITKLGVTSGSMISDTLASQVQHNGETWNCSINATDELELEGLPNSTTVTITNYLNVCPSGCDFTTIQSAINRAFIGDIVNVSDGSYTEGLIINKSITLQGAGSSSSTTVIGQQTISVSNVTIDGFIFSGTVIINDATNVINGGILSNNTFTGTSYGIRIGYGGAGLGVSNIIIRNNQIIANTNKGILFYDAGDYSAQRVSYITVDKNVIANNSGSGISTYGTGHNTITNNNVSDNKGNGISIKYDNEDIVRGNIVRNNSAMGINMHQVTNSTIENNTVFNHINPEVVTTFWGGSIIAGKGSGIYIHEFSQGNIIRFNEVRDNKNGILVSREGSSNNPFNNSINENKITGNSVYAILNALANPSAPTNATRNWWGIVATAIIQSNISDNVSFLPYYLNEEMTILSDGKANIVDVAITPSPAYKFDTLNCSAIYLDIEGYKGNISVSWYNGTIPYLTTTIYNIADGQMFSDLLTAQIQRKGEIWNCTINATDTSEVIGLPNSTTISISNSIPLMNSLEFQPISIFSTTSINCSANATDNDGDLLGINFTIYLNGAYYLSSVANTTDGQAILIISPKPTGTNISCSSFATDYQDISSILSISSVVGNEIVDLTNPVSSETLTYKQSIVVSANTNFLASECIFYYYDGDEWIEIGRHSNLGYNFSADWTIPCVKKIMSAKAICDGIESPIATNILIDRQREICCARGEILCQTFEGTGAGIGLLFQYFEISVPALILMIVFVLGVGTIITAIILKIREHQGG
jgi:nitrous oxidase accessory protein